MEEGVSKLNGIYPCIERSEWSDNRVEFHTSDRAHFDVTLEADGSITIHGSGVNSALAIFPRVSNEVVVRFVEP